MIDDIKKALWVTADQLRANMDAAEYRHLVLGQLLKVNVNVQPTQPAASVQGRKSAGLPR